MIHDVFLRWIVTALFSLSAAECLLAIAAGRRMWAHVVGHSLHFVMSIAMAVMAWPWGAGLPTIGPMVFFLVATVWFVGVGFTGDNHRGVNGYHALMMLAMAWMYAVMNGHLLPSRAAAVEAAHGMSSVDMNMPGMDMSGMAAASSGGGHPTWIGGGNWLCTIVFAIAAIWWLCRYFAQRQAEPNQPSHRFLGIACQAMMAAGMAVMFGVML